MMPFLLAACSPPAHSPVPPDWTPPASEEPAPPVSVPAVPCEVLCIEEVQSDNASTLEGLTGRFQDWIEVRNRSSAAVRLDRVRISDDGEDWVQPPGTLLFPGQVAVWFGDGVDLPFNVSAGETLTLQLDGELADEVTVPDLREDTSWTRYQDALSETCVPSPGAADVAPVACNTVRDLVFVPGVVHAFEITLSPESWATLETSTTFDHRTASGSLSWAGGSFPAVEVELKGGYGSFRADLDTQKTAFKIDLDEWEDRRWRGLDKLVLNSMVQDPTFVHEELTYLLYREAGLAAPRVSYATVTVNGVYFGLYSLIEPVDEALLEAWYGDGSGHLLEAAYGVDFDDPSDADLFEYDSGPDEAAGRAEVLRVIEILDQPWDEATLADLETVLDLEQWLVNLAIEHASWHWDGYWTENNNRIYQHPISGRFTILPHGTDQTWVDGWPEPYEPWTRPIVYDFCMTVQSCRARYGQALLDVAGVLDTVPLEQQLDALVAQTEPYFLVEPRAEETDQHAPQIDATRLRIQTVAQALRDAVAANP